MKLYVASKFTNKQEVRSLMTLLENDGHTITHDWTDDDAAGLEGDELEQYLALNAIACIRGIIDAQAFILIARPEMAGSHTELGLAMGIGRPVLILDGFKAGNQPNIFYNIPNNGLFQHVPDIQTLFTILGHPTSSNPFDKISGVNPFNPHEQN
jgi:hypothetical protein